ncbi:MAG TPA: murein L,D-transpeptidase, partial [Streptomyces sp.]
MGDIRRRAAVFAGVTGLVAPLALVMGSGTAQAASCSTSAGPYQKQVEKFLGRPVDGKQSSADCKAIRAFQTKHGISPNAGYAGSVTWGVMDLMNKQKAVGKNPNKDGKCPTNKGRIACVNLTLQLSWIQDGKKLVYGPVPVRTGRDGFETR